MQLANFFHRPPWPHQERALGEILQVLHSKDSVCVQSPTGGGKTAIISALLSIARQHGKKVIVYNFRRLLVSQMHKTLEGHGIETGVRSAAHKELKNLAGNIQVASVWTDVQRIYNQDVWHYHDADLVIFDEAHMGKGEKALALMQDYLGMGAKIVGFTATPLGLAGMYGGIITAGTKSELRKCGAHVPCRSFAPHELDLAKVRRLRTGEFDMKTVSFSQAIVGQIYEDWRDVNPDGRQTLNFTPGVAESRWCCNLFEKRGVPSGHLDANSVIVGGKEYRDQTGAARNDLLAAWNSGDVVHLSNHSVLREGIDAPSIYCLILSRPIGSLQSYDQIVGRLIRRSDSTPDSVVMLDMAGNYDRHGSPNEDRNWAQLFHMDQVDLLRAQKKQEKKEKKEKEPITCANCGMKRTSGMQCPDCGHQETSRMKKIIEETGTIREVERMVKPKKKPPLTAQKKWDSVFWALKNSKKKFTFSQAAAIYRSKYGEAPPFNLRCMPRRRADWKEYVQDLSWKDLR